MQAQLTRPATPTRFIPAAKAKAGMWIVDPQNPRFNRRIVEIGPGKIDTMSIKVQTDYGNGGEPATSFYGPKDLLRVSDRRPRD